ncbi:MAG: thioredoxin [Methanosarcinaceae archaeon]|nr:thioredoxin [Methanosarcinaceae archaeon]MDD4330929.1 thioredoxin [Methanosarcinaceae archaeon]MDD4749933.1 thioredoxin [Methanosarcinaceae archaeon]
MKPVLMDFSATWCGPCRMQKPILEELEKEYADRVEFKVIDVDENQELASKYGIHAVPTLIIEKDGTEIKRYMGVTQKSVLSEELDKLL